MLNLHPVYRDFASGSKCGSGKKFFSCSCQRDIGMKAQGSGEFARHFRSDGHWIKDVTYRVHMGRPVLNRLMKPMTLSESQLADYKSRAFVDSAERYPFPKILVPKHATVTSRVPFMTLVSSFCDLLQSGGDFTLLRRLWGHFCSSFGSQKLDFAVNWSGSETVVSRLLLLVMCFFWFCIFSFIFVVVIGRLGFAFLHVRRLFQSFLCQGLDLRVLCMTLKSIASLKEYVIQCEMSGTEERSYVLCWERNYLKNICVGCQSVEHPVPDVELVPLARVAHCLNSQRLPLSVVGGSSESCAIIAMTVGNLCVCSASTRTFLCNVSGKNTRTSSICWKC